MQVTPRSEKQIAELNLWEPGEYSFEIEAAEEKLSKNNNEMIEMKVAVYDDAGRVKKLYDYLMNTEMMAYKLRHCSEVCGLLSDYEEGTLKDFQFVGKTGTLKIATQKGKDGNPDQSRISDYVVKQADGKFKAAPRGNIGTTKAEEFDDEIPFG